MVIRFGKTHFYALTHTYIPQDKYTQTHIHTNEIFIYVKLISFHFPFICHLRHIKIFLITRQKEV